MIYRIFIINLLDVVFILYIYCVNLVNLLPVEVNTNIDLSGIGAIQSSAKRTILTGKPADTPLPVEDTMEVAEMFDYQLPAYSFTVIRIKKANEK